MEFTKKESYAIQIVNYLKTGRYPEAFRLSQGMLKKFPKEPLSHYMAAKSFYFSGEHRMASLEGFRAYNLSHTRHDMVVSAVVTASALFELGQYEKGHRLLIQFQKEKNEDVKKLLIIYSMVMERGEDSAKYFKELHELNSRVAEEFILRLAEGRGVE